LTTIGGNVNKPHVASSGFEFKMTSELECRQLSILFSLPVANRKQFLADTLTDNITQKREDYIASLHRPELAPRSNQIIAYKKHIGIDKE
jgi:hypothetical protein